MNGEALTVLIAPDCFGDTLTAVEAAAAIAGGWAAVRPDDQLMLAPQSDGGPGFVDVLASRLGARRSVRVWGPLAAQVDAQWVFDAASDTAYIECAQACGLALLPDGPTPDTAIAAHSFGVGQLLEDALQAGARRVVIGLGGSACTDGGRGLVDALGGLERARARLADVELIAATDVEHPLLGDSGAAKVFGPQKGADPDVVGLLEGRLASIASAFNASVGFDVGAEPGAGAAGGLGAALLALGGRRESGAAVIAAHTALDADLAAAGLIITGEGRFDDQSLHGKVVSALAAGAADTPVIVLAGQIRLDEAALRRAGIAEAHSVTDFAGSVDLAMNDAARQLKGLAQRTATDWGSRAAGQDSAVNGHDVGARRV